MGMRRLLLLLLALGCALALASCGGDDEEPATGSGSGSGNGDWTAEVNAICRKNRDETQRIAAEVQQDSGTGAKATAEIIDRSTDSSKALIGDLRDVDTPDDVSDDYEAFLDSIEEGTDLYPRLADAIRENKEDKDLTQQFESIANETRPFAKEHGLTDCVPDEG
jgi:hypothetical protein